MRTMMNCTLIDSTHSKPNTLCLEFGGRGKGTCLPLLPKMPYVLVENDEFYSSQLLFFDETGKVTRTNHR
jgi:hypothetical protein